MSEAWVNLPIGAWIAAGLVILAGVIWAWPAPALVRLLAAPQRARARKSWRRMWARPEPVDLGMVAVEVATRLRAGATTESAWKRALGRHGVSSTGVNDAGIPEGLERLNTGRKRRRPPGAAAAAAGIAAACRLSYRLGAPLAEVLEECANGISEAADAEAAKKIALAAPKATARLLGALPLVAFALAAALGAHPVEVAIGGGIGSWAIGAGVVLWGAGAVWSWRLIRQAHVESEGVDPALVVDLTRVALQSGAAIPEALSALADALPDPELGKTARMLLYGAAWEQAWEAADARYQILADALEPAWQDGAAPAILLQRAGSNFRARRARQAREAAQKLGVRLVLPLGLCLLPAFMALGLAPVIISMATSVLGI